jgi:hypothetical protein
MSVAQRNRRDVRVGVNVAGFAGHSSRSAVFLVWTLSDSKNLGPAQGR